jgi:hypothetical protein
VIAHLNAVCGIERRVINKEIRSHMIDNAFAIRTWVADVIIFMIGATS